MKKVVVAVAAHPDDEALGCGGTLARHAHEGDEVHVVFLTDGVGARGAALTVVQARRAAAADAGRLLGVSHYHWFDFPDNRLDGVELLTIVQGLESVFSKIAPSIIYTHHGGDLNIDHQLACRAVLTACRPQPGTSVSKILAFETVSSTAWFPGSAKPFEPNYFVDIGQHFGAKITAIEAYSAELRAAPHARSRDGVEALARHRGCSVGVEYAEAFVLLRSLLSMSPVRIGGLG